MQDSDKNIILNFENINYTGGRLIYGNPNAVSLKNMIIKQAPQTESVALYNGFPTIITDKSSLYLKDIIPDGYKIVYGSEKLDLNQSASLFKAGYINDTYIIKDIKLLSVDNFDNLQHGYETVEAKKIVFDNKTGNSINLKKIYLEDDSSFELIGEGTLALDNNDANDTSYSIKPKIGLSTGIHSTNIIAIDNDNNYYVENISIEVKNNKVVKPTVTSETKFEQDGLSHRITFDGFDVKKMIMSGMVETDTTGTHTVTITLREGYCWEDESTDPLEFEWYIFDRIDITNINIISNKFVNVNKEYQLEADIEPINASYKALTWSVENGTGSATITEAGIFKPLSEGTVIVKATSTFDGSMYTTKEFNILSENSISRIALTSSSYYVKNNTTIDINGYVNGKKDNSKLTWSSSDTSIATVSLGKVTTKSTGKVTIKAADESGAYEEISFFVYDNDEHTKLGIIGQGMRIDFYSDVMYSSSSLTWVYSDRSIFEGVVGGGYNNSSKPYNYYLWDLKPKASGYSNVRLATKNTDITIGEVDVYTYNPISSINSDYSEIILEKNQGLKLDSGSKLPNVTEEYNGLYFIIENPEIASVDYSGRVTGLKNGNTTLKIISKYNNQELIIPVSVVDDKNNYSILTEKITIEGESTDLRVGKTFQYSASFNPTNVTNKNITWSVENGTGSATINESGLLTAVSSGTVKIKATATDGSGVVGTKEVTLKDYYDVEEIIIKSPDLYVATTSSIYMKAYVYPNFATNKNVTWSSSDTSIATIDPDTGGLTTKSKVGDVTIKATATDGSGVVGTILLHVGYSNIKLGESTSLGNSTWVSYSDVKWEIGDETIITPTGQTGKSSIGSSYKHYIYVKGNKVGTTTIKMKTISGDVLATSTVYVYNPNTSIITDKTSLEMSKNEKVKLNASVEPTDSSNEFKKVIFTSTDSSIVSVDSLGNVTAHKNGTAYIQIMSQYGNIVKNVKVTVSTFSTDLIIDKTSISLNDDNRTYQINATVVPDDAINSSLIYTSEDTSIASVSETGLITAHKNGIVKINVKTEDGRQNKDIIVTISGIRKDITKLSYNNINNVTFDGSNKEPNVIIKDGDYTLIKGTDYNITYLNNKNVGTATITINGINNYKETKTINFEITKANIEYTSSGVNIVYDGNLHGIDLNVTSPSNVEIKYADASGNYTLNEMPKYKDVGTYIIKYQLSCGDNYNIVKAQNNVIISEKDSNINYTGKDKTITFDGKSYGIDLNVTSPSNVEIKYADASGNYTLTEMPKYKDVGIYTIRYKLSLGSNYKPVYGSNKLTINKGIIKDESTGYNNIYDGKAHGINLKVSVSDYTVEYTYSTINYNAYYTNNYSTVIPETKTNTNPVFTKPGYYQVAYRIKKANYEDLTGCQIVQINGVTGINSTNFKVIGEKIVVRSFITSIHTIYDQFNILMKNGASYKHLDNSNKTKDSNTVATGDSFGIVVDNAYTFLYKMIILGDVNGDGKISALDYVKIKNHIMKEKMISGDDYLTSADVNEDGKISALDYVRIKNYIMNGGK